MFPTGAGPSAACRDCEQWHQPGPTDGSHSLLAQQAPSLAPLSPQAIVSLLDRLIFTQVFVAVLPSRGWPIDQTLPLGWMH